MKAKQTNIFNNQMTLSVKIYIILTILLFLAMESSAGSTTDLINVSPKECFKGNIIEIFGWTKPNYPDLTYINLEFLKPVSGDKISERVPTDSMGKYSFLFKETDEAGRWQVTAWKAGTNLKKSAEFEVSQTIFLIPLCQEVNTMSGEITETYTYFHDMLDPYPYFSGKEELLADIKDLFKELTEMNNLLAQLKINVEQMNQLLIQIKDFPIPARDELIKASQTANTTIKETQKQSEEIREVLQKSKQESEWCYLWMAYYDLSDQLQFYNNFLADSLKGIAQNLIKAKLTQGLDPKLQNLIGKVVDALLGSGKSPVDTANKIMGKMAELGTKIYGQLLTNCTTYIGDCEGEFRTELLHKEMVFYTMSYKLSGKMELTFQKRKPSDPAVYLKGRFKGKAKNCTCTITMAPFAIPDTIGPVYCLAATPLVSKRSFILYLEGKAADELMELKLTKAGHDFKLKSRAFYIMLSSAAYKLPVPGDFSFPLQNAEWFLTRVTEISNPAIEYFQLPISAKDQISTAEKEFKRTIYLPETRKRVGVRVNLKLNIKVCSPKCR